jgi:hypothetical protein
LGVLMVPTPAVKSGVNGPTIDRISRGIAAENSPATSVASFQQDGRDIEQEVKMTKPRIVGADSDQNPDPAAEPASETVETQTASMPQAEIEQLDDEEKEFRALRRDLPGVKGTSAAGIVTISVGKKPAKNEFFSGRTRNSDRSSQSWILRLAWSNSFSR